MSKREKWSSEEKSAVFVGERLLKHAVDLLAGEEAGSVLRPKAFLCRVSVYRQIKPVEHKRDLLRAVMAQAHSPRILLTVFCEHFHPLNGYGGHRDREAIRSDIPWTFMLFPC